MGGSVSQLGFTIFFDVEGNPIAMCIFPSVFGSAAGKFGNCETENNNSSLNIRLPCMDCVLSRKFCVKAYGFYCAI